MAASEKKDGSGSGLSVAIVATVFVALAGILVGQWQLVGTRPSPTEIAGYPPGIPALLPGERISAETSAYLRELVATGARLHGASDPRFERVHVLIEG